MDKKKTLEFCLENIKKIKDELDVISENRQLALQFFRNDESIVKVIDGRSKAVTTDLQDTVEWLKPAILEIFTGSDDVVTLEPFEEKDVEAVKNQELLINKQVRHKNPWFKIMHDVLHDALLLKYGAVKYQWYLDTQFIEKRYEGLTEEEYQAKISEKNLEVLNTEEIVIQPEQVIPAPPPMGMDGIPTMMAPPAPPQVIPAVKEYNLDCQYRVEDEYPKLDAVPAENLLFSLKTKELCKASFVCEMIRVNKYEFIKKYGKEKFKAVENFKSRLEESESDVADERLKDLGGLSFIYDDKTNEWLVYECFFYEPDTGEARLFKFCGEEDLADEKNQYGKPPYRGFTAVLLAHREIGMSMYDLVCQIQKFRTGILRQIADNIWKSNFRRYFGNKERIDMDAFYNNNVANAFIHVQGDPNSVIAPEQKAQMAPEVFQFWETLLVERDYHTGVPRSYQGVNSNILNETFRGQNQQINQAGQRIQLLARVIAEIFVVPLMNDIIDLNLKFLKKKTSIRYLNKWIEITPDNIIGKADVTVNVGLGTSNKQLMIGQIQQLLGLYGQVYKTGIPVVTAQNVHHAMKELVKAMGFKDTANWVTDPKLIEAVKQLIGIAMQVGQGNPQIMQLVQQIGMLMGIPPPGQEEKEGGNGEDKGSDFFSGQNTPENAMTPAQANNPVLTPGGGPFFG